jgi:hypothetical protein
MRWPLYLVMVGFLGGIYWWVYERPVAGPRGFQWSTSLTRTDTGDGACEIMWVDTVDVR